MVNNQKIPFDQETVSKCLCPGCPVQTGSGCVADLKRNLKGALARSPLKREEIPGVYCSTGKATCTDLDPSKQCQCGGCSVFHEYNLASRMLTVGYYCRDGAAQ